MEPGDGIDAGLPEASGLPMISISDAEASRARSLGLHRTDRFDLEHPVITWVERVAATDPDRPAVSDHARALSYAQLAGEARRIAGLLDEAGVRPGTVVAVGGQRSSMVVSAFLALELVGGIYLPIEAAWPARRISDVVTRGRASVLLTTDAMSSLSPTMVAGANGAKCTFLSTVDAQPSAPWKGPPWLASADQPRYVLFTSGSTGRPKGAIIEHRGMMNHLLSKVHDLDLSEHDVVAQTAPLGFDISVWQMLAPLLAGGRVHVLTGEQGQDPELITAGIRKERITVLELVPTLVRLLLDTAAGKASRLWPTLRWLLATGEELPTDLARRWLDSVPQARLLNAYGPTECSDDVTHHEVTHDDLSLDRLPIGAPVANTSLYVLKSADGTWQACSVGEPGELFVGGIGVGRGYVGDPERTRAGFFRDGFASTPTARLYRTGDAVRLLPQGCLQFLGRIDQQVKLAGMRIEPGEIEAALNRHPAVAASAVVVHQSSDGG